MVWRTDDGRKGHNGDSEWHDQCRRWTGNRNGMCCWQGPEGPGRDEGGKGGGGSRGHRVVGGRGTGLVPEGGRVGVKGLATDTWVVSEGGCASAASGDLRSGAPHTILSYPILPISLLSKMSASRFLLPIVYPLIQESHKHDKRHYKAPV